MVAARKTEGPSDPVFREVLSRHVGQWAPVLVARILDEEKMLTAELAGYREYRRQVRYRLVPGVW